MLEVTRKVEAALEAMRPGLKDVEIDPTIFRPATFIERSIDNLTSSLLTGCILVVVVIGLFLFDWRTAIISLTAIPLSLMATIILLYWMGLTINTMIIAGLVIALGEVVDDAIIDVENIVRRLRINRTLAKPRSSFRVVLEASLEVRSAVVYATVIIMLVFLPVFFLEGLPGAFFRPLAIGYVVAILTSLFVALIVTPAMCLLILPGHQVSDKEPPLSRWLRTPYRVMLPWFASRPKSAFLFLAVSLAGTLIVLNGLGQEFLPNFQETDFLMHFVEKPGTSIEAMNRVTIQASRELRAIPGVRNFGSHIGRAEVADEVVGPNFTELWISIDTDVDYNETLGKIQTAVDGYPGLYRDVLTYLRERVKEVLTGASSSVVVRIYGSDLNVLRAKAKEAEAVMAKVEGINNLKVEANVLVPQLEVKLRHDAIEQFGLTPGQVRRAITTVLRGTRSAKSTKARRSRMSSSGALRRLGQISIRFGRFASIRPPEARFLCATLRMSPSSQHQTKSNVKAARVVLTSPAMLKDVILVPSHVMWKPLFAGCHSTVAIIRNFSVNTRLDRNLSIA